MKPSSCRSLELLEKYKEQDLYLPLLEQLGKDFGRAGIKLSITVEMPPQQVLTTLRETIYVLIMERWPEYLNLLYAVDVPEDTVKNIPLKDPVDMASEVSYLILARECQKVSLKRKFGS